MTQHKLTHFSLLSLLILAFGQPSDAFAEKDGNGHGKGKHHHVEKGHKGSHKDKVKVVFEDSDRVMIREYLADSYHSNCPPGLAKKHNGCLPPGQAKKRYVIGRPLLVDWEPVPFYLTTRLHPAPIGYQYVMVDRDVLLISEASKHVIDAVTLLSAVGN